MTSVDDDMAAAARKAEEIGRQPEGARTNGDARKAAPRRAPDVGEALRAVYRNAVAEQVPDEMLDLLNKLG